MVNTCSWQSELETLGDSEHRTFGLEPNGTVSMVTKRNENILKCNQNMLCEKQTPVESKMRDIEDILSRRRQHAHGSNAKNIFAYEGEEKK